MSDTPKPAHLRVVREEESEDRDTIEILIQPSPEDESAGILLALPTKTFARGEIIVDIEHLPFFYLIVRGTAEEYALSSLGEPIADPVTLRPDDVIGIHRVVRVVAKSDLVVRVIDFNEVRRSGNRLLFDRTNEIVREAAIGASTHTRDRFVRAQEEHLELVQTVERFLGLEREVRALRERDVEHVKHGKMLSREILQLREILASVEQRLSHRETELDHRMKELESAASITKMYKDDYLELVQEFSSYADAFERLQEHSDPTVSNRGVQLLGLLHTLRIKAGGF